MREIADEIGVSSALLHYYFGTKEDLLAAVVRALHDEQIAEWRRAMAQVEGGALERVAAGLRRASDRFQSDPESWHLAFDMYQTGLRNPRLRKRVRAMADDLVEHIADEVRELTAEVPLPPPLTPEDCGLAIAGAIDGIALLATLTDDEGGGAIRAFLAMLLSFTAMGMLSVGKESDPELFRTLLDAPPAPPPAGG